MKATRILHDLGQSLWLDNITRNLLRTGMLRRYIDEFSITGLTSNPTIFDHAIKNSDDYDDAIKSKLAEGKSGEKLFFELALDDLAQAADLFRPVYDRTCGVDGWVSLEVSPLLAYDTKSTIAEAKDLHAQARRPNVFIKIPGNPEGLPAIEEAIFAGVPINYIGHAERWDDLDIEGNIESRDCLVRYRRNGKVLAVASIFRDIDNLKEEAAMESAG